MFRYLARVALCGGGGDMYRWLRYVAVIVRYLTGPIYTNPPLHVSAVPSPAA